LTRTILKRLVGVAAAFAVALGMTVGLSKPAEAKKSVWDKVAACESGGNWKINTGNGYYGGLQFSRSTWNAFGGRRYAKTANKASKSEQIAIARRVLAGQGPGAWPHCGRKAGLTKANGNASRKATAGSSASKSSGLTKAEHKKIHRKKVVKVKKGDNLHKIARRWHVKGGWKKIWKLNYAKLGPKHRIHTGQKLRIRR
jgi:resuscitation-promoting factor RpfA